MQNCLNFRLRMVSDRFGASMTPRELKNQPGPKKTSTLWPLKNNCYMFLVSASFVGPHPRKPRCVVAFKNRVHFDFVDILVKLHYPPTVRAYRILAPPTTPHGCSIFCDTSSGTLLTTMVAMKFRTFSPSHGLNCYLVFILK